MEIKLNSEPTKDPNELIIEYLSKIKITKDLKKVEEYLWHIKHLLSMIEARKTIEISGINIFSISIEDFENKYPKYKIGIDLAKVEDNNGN